MPFSQISPPSPSPTESIRLIYTSVSLLLSRTRGYCYHLSKFHIYALVYCIGVFLSGLLHYSFRIDCFVLLGVQGTLESSPAPQFKNINSLVPTLFYSPALTGVHDYWKNNSLSIQTFVSKVVSLYFLILYLALS